MEFNFEHEGKYIKRTDDCLAGQKFRIAMDNGEELDVRFVGGEIVEWRRVGERLRWEKYGCLQADEQTFGVQSSQKVGAAIADDIRSIENGISRRIAFWRSSARFWICTIGIR